LCLLLLTNASYIFTVILQSAEGIPLSCGAPQSIELKLQKLDYATVYTNWTWDNGNIVVSLWNMTYCDLPLNVSVSYVPHGSTTVYRSNGSSTVKPSESVLLVIAHTTYPHYELTY